MFVQILPDISPAVNHIMWILCGETRSLYKIMKKDYNTGS